MPADQKNLIDSELDNRTKHHVPAPDQRKRMALIRSACNTLAKIIRDNTPESREQSKAIGYLTDEVMMLANAAIARNEQVMAKIDDTTCVECGRAKETPQPRK